MILIKKSTQFFWQITCSVISWNFIFVFSLIFEWGKILYSPRTLKGNHSRENKSQFRRKSLFDIGSENCITKIENLICENGQDKDIDARSVCRSFRFTRVSNYPVLYQENKTIVKSIFILLFFFWFDGRFWFRNLFASEALICLPKFQTWSISFKYSNFNYFLVKSVDTFSKLSTNEKIKS